MLALDTDTVEHANDTMIEKGSVASIGSKNIDVRRKDTGMGETRRKKRQTSVRITDMRHVRWPSEEFLEIELFFTFDGS